MFEDWLRVKTTDEGGKMGYGGIGGLEGDRGKMRDGIRWNG